MFIEMVPDVPNTTVINKKIVYSDTPLEINEESNNIPVRSIISGVSKYSLETCLRMILESNPDIVFDTIQYSKTNRELYFYADSKISAQTWIDRTKGPALNVLNTSKEISKALTDSLSYDIPEETDCISLYDVSRVVAKYAKGFDSVKDKYEKSIRNRLNEEFYDTSLAIYGLDYKENKLSVGFKYFSDYDKIVFAKKDDDLYIVESESWHAQDLLVHVGKYLSDLFDRLNEFKSFKTQYVFDSKTLNPNFRVVIAPSGVEISTIANNREDKFGLSYGALSEKYSYKSNSTLVLGTVGGIEEELFKRTFVRIDNCPEWSRDELYQIRQAQLARAKQQEQERIEREKRLEAERIAQEEREQKRLEFRRKLFFWKK